MSEVKVNKISPRTNCGTVQLGDSGDTFTIPAGATITNNGTANGFGATGSVNWQTTVKTGDFTAVSGEGYFVNTTSGAVDVTLPAGSAGAIIGIKDYAGTFDTNEVTLVRNGSDKIGGNAIDATLVIEGQAVTLVFIDSTQGWLVTDSGLQSDANTNPFIIATGGTIVTDGNFKTHIFTGPGTFCVSQKGTPAGSNTVDYFVVAGGGGTGGGSACQSGGGGGGGFRVSNSPIGAIPAPTMSPLSNPAGIPVSAQGYSITVGAGGAGAPTGPGTSANNGSNSIFATITSAGGGGGAGGTSPSPARESGLAGGSGGGGAAKGASGNTPPVSPPQGNNGGDGSRSAPTYGSGGGGGAGAVGQTGTPTAAGNGGDGSYIADGFVGPPAPSYGTPGPVSSVRYFSGGGGGGGENSTGSGGAGGGGAGIANPAPSSNPGTVNTGGGAGTANDSSGPVGASGGSGIVMIRYKFQ